MARIEELPSTPAKPTAGSLQVVTEGNDIQATETKQGTEDRGFVGGLIGSIFEPGVNLPLYQAMNISFLLLLFSLLFLAFVTSWNYHVLFLMVVSTGLWLAMIWFVQEISKVQHSTQNAPPPITGEGVLGTDVDGDSVVTANDGERKAEGKKDI